MQATSSRQRGIALLAVLFALLLLALLALPFAISMSVGADAAVRDMDQVAAEQGSASVRDLLLADAALSHPAFDPTPTWDGLAEWPDRVDLPKAFDPLREGGRVLLGGEVWDLQRKLSLDSVSPLVLANLLGTTTRLREDLLPEATTMAVDDAERLPESGFVWLAHEIVHYAGKQGPNLVDLERGLFKEAGFSDGKQPIAATTLVLDYRCVVAVTWPFTGRAQIGGPQRRPYADVGELVEIARAGFGSFTAEEIDTLRESLSTDVMAATAATWGRPERVFDELLPGQSKSLRVKSALHLGAGSTIRLRNLQTGVTEYALVMLARTENSTLDFSRTMFRLELLEPVKMAFPALDTVAEPLIPAPVNINTAAEPVLAAVLEEVRRAMDVFIHAGDERRRTAPPRSISRAEARDMAAQITALRSGDPAVTGQGPFVGWQDVCERLFRPRLEAATGDAQKWALLYLYRNLQTGRDNTIEMGTVPWCFRSGPWVGYRAAASRARSTVAAGVAGRHERTGVAAAVPGFLLQHQWNTQEAFEEAFELDRRAPYWITTPVNVGSPVPGDTGNDPAPRYYPHVVPMAFPGLGFGSPRVPATDPADAGIRPAPASARGEAWAGALYAFDRVTHSPDWRGHDVSRDGPYPMVNIGPSSSGGSPIAGLARHDRISFPFSNQFGFMGRFATSFWLEPAGLEGTTLFDHSDGDPDRNRVALHGRDGNLVLEVIDEAGIDPNPSDSPSGVARTAAERILPLAELGLPADTPVHISMSAYGSRGSELSLAVDGMTRGKSKFVTYLTAALPVFDPSLANNSTFPPGQSTSAKYIDLQVESTEGFPPVGTLRIGTELFEYSSISANTFHCKWLDSLGGRAARMSGREFRPSIPVDGNGEPTVDIDDLQAQGVNLDVFPEHPVGSQVELYGYATLLSEDSPMMVGSTRLDGAVGGFAVARAFIDNPRPIVISNPSFPPFQIGVGIDETWTGTINLADPLPTGRDQPPNAAQTSIADAFPTTGGYALLIQRALIYEGAVPGNQVGGSTRAGGIELVKYQARQGTKLTGVQRAQTLPGDDSQISTEQYQAGVAQRFVTDFSDWPWDVSDPQVLWDDIPTLIVWVVPVSLSLQSTTTVWDPQVSGLSEWVQLYPDGGDPDDTEWVRYDALADGKHIARGNRRAWDRTRWELTQSTNRDTVRIGPLGPQSTPSGTAAPPWGSVTPTADYIGYVPQLEADFPQIRSARLALRFRGDSFTGTTSHPQSNALVTQCQRLKLDWGNFGALTGRVGRNDRVAIVQGSAASGTARPAVEWHTVNWGCRRFNSDNLAQNQPSERLGPWPFQLVAFQDGVKNGFIGPPRGTQVLEPRQYDRVVKFPSGELPAAWCENPTIGGGVGNLQPITGFVDEVEVTSHAVADLVVEEAFTASANSFRLDRSMTYDSTGPVYPGTDLTALLPTTGGLLAIDGEILAYQTHADGLFTVAQNGRALLNTEAKDHDRGARVHFLTHRPMAILAGGVGARAEALPVLAGGGLPRQGGTVLLGRELLHYAWMRAQGDAAVLEMPKWYPPEEDATSAQARGLFRGRFGTAGQGGSGREPVIGFPFRYWDRHADRSDDPELAYFQLTVTEAPVFFRTLRWREETVDPRVDVRCLVRTDSKAPWSGLPGVTPGLWQFEQGSDADVGHRIGAHASRLEIRFEAIYSPGVLDLTTFRAHGWKTSVRVKDVRVEYEGQGRIFHEQVTAR